MESKANLLLFLSALVFTDEIKRLTPWEADFPENLFAGALFLVAVAIYFPSIKRFCRAMLNREKPILPQIANYLLLIAFIFLTGLGVMRVFNTPSTLNDVTDPSFVEGTLDAQGIVAGWGSVGFPGCAMHFNTVPLARFANDFVLVLLCGVGDATMDRHEDTEITISSPFGIFDRDLQIAVDYSPQMLQHIERLRGDTSTPIGIWHQPVLLPIGIDGQQVRKLSDVNRFGGIMIVGRPPSVP